MVITAIIYAVVFDRSALAPAGDGIIGSFTSIFSSVTSGIANLIDSFFHAVVSAVSGALSSAGSYLYNNTIGKL
ncbi:MAG: hypothetical protein KIS29_09835 [Thermoplasmata archaeon]|nr:hypothetical protein [Candidatus Sysuiplasma jiujiangense]